MRKVLLLLGFLAVLPFSAFASDCSDEEDFSCSCINEDGEKSSVTDSHVTDDSSCASYCSTQGDVAYEVYCGDSLSPTNSGDIGDFLDSLTPISKEDPAVPALNVPLPTLSEEEFKNSIRVDDDGYITTNMIGLYVNAVFSYGIVLAALFGVLMLTISGFQYMTAGGDKGAVSKAKDRMQNTVFGLILLMATYCIAFLIDPRTTRFNPLTLENIKAVEYFPPEGEDIDITPNNSLTGDADVIEGDYLILGDSDMELDADALTALQEAAEDFYTTHEQQMYVTSAKRDLDKQARLFYNNCLKHGGVCSPITCNPASTAVIAKNGSRYVLTGELAGETSSDAIIAGIVSHASYGNCPHTSAVAVDVWCNDGGGSYQHDPACQQTLIETMIDHGFCRLTAEAWHFEFNSKKVSSKCLTSNTTASYTNSKGTFTPGSDCRRWDFTNNKCVTAK